MSFHRFALFMAGFNLAAGMAPDDGQFFPRWLSFAVGVLMLIAAWYTRDDA